MGELTIFEAAHILGTTPQDAKRLLSRRERTIPGVEAVALVHYRWRPHVNNPDSYWVTVSQAALILEVSVPRVKQLLDKDPLPHLVTDQGVRLMRREQLETVANARLSRKLQQGHR